MSTLGGLYLPKFETLDYGRAVNQGILGASQQVQGQTELVRLAELKRQQEEEAAARQFMQQHPDLALGGGTGGMPQSLLGAPQPAGAPPGGGPMMQQQVMPGQPPGAPQMVPGGQDLSQFATPGAPPTSTLGAPGPQPQGQPANPLMDLMRQNPGAALLAQKQMQQSQAAALQSEEGRLSTGVKVLEYVGRLAQGVTDQAGLGAMKQDLSRLQLHQYAAQLPEVYSKEAMEPFIAKALDVKESLTLQAQDLQAQAAVIKARKEGRSTDVDNQLRAMGVQPGQETPGQIKEALQAVEDAKVRVSASHGTGQIVKGPTGEYIRVKPGTDQVEVIKGPGGEPLREKPSEAEQKSATLANSVAAANKLAAVLEDKGYEPKGWEKGADMLPLGLGNLVTSSEHQQYRQVVSEFASAWLYGVSGAQINDDEWERANQTFFRQPNEDKAAVALKRQRRADLVKQLEQQTAATGRTGTQAQPTSQGSTGTGKPVAQMNAEETRAEIAAIKARGGR